MNPNPDPQLPDRTLKPWPPELESEAVRSPEAPSGASRPQAAPISVASVWQMESPATADAALSGQSDEFVYRRDGFPNERALASKLAQLHSASRGIVTAQGMSAISGLALTVLRPKSTVWIADELYGKTSKLFSRDLARWEVDTRVFDPCNAEQVRELSSGSADLVFIETISNPRLRVPDIAQVAAAAHQAGARLAVDNTFATHLICRPLEFGADFVVESLSKQVNGHSDSMLGLLCGRDEECMQAAVDTVSTFGLASSPLDCYLTHRGLMSLGLRLQRACVNALALAEALLDCAVVECVDYPGLEQGAVFSRIQRQFCGGFGWMLCFRVPADRGSVVKLFESLRPEFPFVPSLGDISTTISHPATTSHRSASPEELERLGIGEGTIRVSCGVEPTDWLVDKFTSAVRSTFA